MAKIREALNHIKDFFKTVFNKENIRLFFKKFFSKINEVDENNDMKYRGPFSYRWLRIIGWLCLAFSIVPNAVNFGAKSAELFLLPKGSGYADSFASAMEIFYYFAYLPLPLFLLANFGFILQNRKTMRNMIRNYLIFTLGIALIFSFCIYHYLIETYLRVVKYQTSFASAREIAQIFIANLFSNGLHITVFVDLLLFSLISLFLFYRPKNYFQGKKIFIFRSFAILPIAYEIVCLILKTMNTFAVKINGGNSFLPFELYPLMPNKPLLMFIAFLALIAFVKIREIMYIKRGKTYDEYEEFLKSNTNSTHFATFAAILFAVIGLSDMLISQSLTIGFIDQGMDEYDAIVRTFAMGFGSSFCLLIASPFAFFYSYNKRHKTKFIDLLVPICGVIVVAILFLEVSHDVFISAPISKT